MTMVMTSVDEEVITEYDEQGNRKMAHIIDCPDDKDSAGAWVTEATFLGLPVTALCGYKWVPTRDPKKFPVCQPCVDEAERRVKALYGSPS